MASGYYPFKYSRGYVSGRDFGAEARTLYFGPPLSFWFKSFAFAVLVYGTLTLFATACHG